MASKSLDFNIFGRDVSASRTLAKVRGEAKTTGTGFMAMGKAIAGAFVIAGIADWAKETFKAISAYDKLNAQSAAVVKSTGGAAKVTAGQIHEYALQLEKQTTVSGESIQAGENMLATFTSIRNETGKGNDIFNKATQAVTDMSVAMGRDLPQSAILVGKALNDPIKGVTSLRRVGVMLNKTQTDQIKLMVQGRAPLEALALMHVNLTGKQKKNLSVLLKLEPASKALGDAGIKLNGKQKKLFDTMTKGGDIIGAQKVILGELSKEFGGSASAKAKTFTGKMAALKEQFGHVSEDILTAVIPNLKKFADFLLKKVVPQVKNLATWVGKNSDLLGPLAGTVLGVYASYKILNGIVKAATSIQWLYNAALDANPIGVMVAAFTGFIIAEGWVATHTKDLSKVTIDAAGNIVDFFRGASVATGKWAKAGVVSIMKMILWCETLPIRIGASMRGWVVKVSGGIAKSILLFRSVPVKIGQIFAKALGWLTRAGRNVLQGFWNGLTDKWTHLTSWVSGIADWIRKHKGPISLDRQLLVPAGRAIMTGFLSGLTGGFSHVQKFVGGVSRRLGSGVGQWSTMVSQALSMLGQSQSLLPGVMRRINLESGGNPNAINLWDSNAKAGHPSQGLMQTIPSTFAAYAGGFARKGITDPFANIYAGLRYALSRYGSIGAIDPLVHPGGYAMGTDFVPQTGSYMVGERGPERVVLPRGSKVIPNNHLGGINVIIQSKGGIDLSRYIEVKIEQADAKASRRAGQG